MKAEDRFNKLIARPVWLCYVTWTPAKCHHDLAADVTTHPTSTARQGYWHNPSNHAQRGIQQYQFKFFSHRFALHFF
jgi:hypothetical protein